MPSNPGDPTPLSLFVPTQARVLALHYLVVVLLSAERRRAADPGAWEEGMLERVENRWSLAPDTGAPLTPGHDLPLELVREEARQVLAQARLLSAP